MVVILVTVLIDSLSLGLIIPILPTLLGELSVGGTANAAMYGGALLFTYAAMQFIFAPILGGLSDCYGRRPILITSLFAFFINYLIMGFAPSLAWLFFGRMLAGIAGATLACANAYTADVSPLNKRSKNFALINTAQAIGLILGPVIGATLGEYGTRTPFFAAALFSLLNALCALVVLKESLNEEHYRKFTLKRANPLGSIIRVSRIKDLGGFLLIYFFVVIAFDVNTSIWPFYTIERFQWSSVQIGMSLTYTGILLVLSLAVFMPWLVDKIGEVNTLYFSFMSCIFSYICIALSPSGEYLYLFLIFLALGTMSIPLLKGFMSKRIASNAQGELQGAVTSVMSIGILIAPLTMTQLFGYFSLKDSGYYFPGAPFILAAILLCVSFIAAKRLTKKDVMSKS